MIVTAAPEATDAAPAAIDCVLIRPALARTLAVGDDRAVVVLAAKSACVLLNFNVLPVVPAISVYVPFRSE